MKTKTLISTTLKIIGLLLLWKSILATGAMISGIGIVIVFLSKQHVDTSFMITTGVSLILNFILPLIATYFFLFKTEKIATLITGKDQEEIDLNIDKHVFYHILVFGFTAIIHGTGNFSSYNYNTDTKTEYIRDKVLNDNNSPSNTKQEKVFVTDSYSSEINFLALIEIIIGIILLTKATEFSRKIERNFSLKLDRIVEKEGVIED